MTYQVAMVGSDGIVIASDKQELNPGKTTKPITKLRCDPTGRFAWAFAGKEDSSLVSRCMKRDFANGELKVDSDMEAAIRSYATQICLPESLNHKPNSTILCVDGLARKIFYAELRPADLTEFTYHEDKCLAGDVGSMASLFPEHFYSADMSVDRLAIMAAYAVWLANRIDPLVVEGLDIAIYRYNAPSPKFEFKDRDAYLREAQSVHDAVCNVFPDRVP